MKKIVTAVALVVGAGISGAAFAGPTGTLSSGNSVVEIASCPMLSQKTPIGVSTNVHGGFQCDETNNVIRVAACHEGGSRQIAVVCAVIDPDGVANTGDEYFNGVGCDQARVDNGERADEPSYNAYGGASSGGSMLELPLGGRCDAATTLSSITFWQ